MMKYSGSCGIGAPCLQLLQQGAKTIVVAALPIYAAATVTAPEGIEYDPDTRRHP